MDSIYEDQKIMFETQVKDAFLPLVVVAALVSLEAMKNI